MESLIGLPALNALFVGLGDQVKLVILSDRFGGQHGGAFRQLVRGIRQSGLRMTCWLGFDIVAAQATWRIAQACRWLGRRAPTLRTVRDLAAQYGATVIETADVNSEEAIAAVRCLDIDVVVVMNFDQILKERLIRSPKVATINIHPSLLPEFRGPCPVFWALLEGRPELGVTVHLIDNAEIDAGPVIAQARVAREPTMSVAEATSMLFDRGVGLLIAHLGRDLRSQSCAQPRSGSTYQSFPTPHDIAAAKAKGVCLCRGGQLVKLAWAALRRSY